MEEVSTAQGYRLTVDGDRPDTAAYLYLPNHPRTPDCVSSTIRLASVLKYTGAEINLDLDANGAIMGIEILE